MPLPSPPTLPLPFWNLLGSAMTAARATWQLAPGRCTAERTVVAADAAWADDDEAVAAAVAAAAADPKARVLTYTVLTAPRAMPTAALANAGFVRWSRHAAPALAPPAVAQDAAAPADGPSAICYGRILAVPSTRLYGGQPSTPALVALLRPIYHCARSTPQVGTATTAGQRRRQQRQRPRSSDRRLDTVCTGHLPC